MSWGRFRLVLGVVFVISGFAMASRLSNPRYPQNGFQGVERQASLLIPILIGAVLIWWGRGFSILYLFSLALVLGGLAVALWGPEWGPACRPHEACLAVAYSLPGIWVASVLATGALLGLVAFMDGRRISRSRSS